MGRLRRFWGLGPRERLYCMEAAVLLLLANLCIRAVAFRHIDRGLRARWDRRPARKPGASVEEIKLVELSVARAERAFGWKDQCLCRSMAAYVMLRRRGVPATILAGARASDGAALQAHAWLQIEAGVLGRISHDAGYPAVLRIGHDPSDAGAERAQPAS